MGDRANDIIRCIDNTFNLIKRAPQAFQSELDLHTEIYRVLYNNFRKEMYFNKTISNRDKIIHSNYYADIKSSGGKTILKKKGKKQVFFDMSLLGKGIDYLFEFKFEKPFGDRAVYTDIVKITRAIDKTKTAFVINVLYTDRTRLYSNKKNMIKWVSYMALKLKKKLNWSGVYKNKRTTIYYYFLYCNFKGDYLKILCKIKNSKIQFNRGIYNGENINLNHI